MSPKSYQILKRKTQIRQNGVSNSDDDVFIQSPILGKHFNIPDLYQDLQDIQLNDTLPYVPIYCHFIVPDIQPVIRPKTPPILTSLRAELHGLESTKAVKNNSE